jgi:prepilin-type N-terminal cleavage/methylation domain-containing protein
MIQPDIKTRKKLNKTSGVTLIECLVVITILAGLIAAVGSSFTMTLKSYVGEYAAEGSELESQRAALEIEYFASRAVNTVIMADPANSTTTGYFPNLGGTRVELTQPNGDIVAFQYRATGVVAADGTITPISGVHGYPGGITYIGDLGVNIRGYAYYYTRKAKFVPQNNWRYPFQVSSEGGLAFRWSVPTPNSGDIYAGGAVTPGL